MSGIDGMASGVAGCDMVTMIGEDIIHFLKVLFDEITS
jgi:hypothetical protein